MVPMKFNVLRPVRVYQARCWSCGWCGDTYPLKRQANRDAFHHYVRTGHQSEHEKVVKILVCDVIPRR